MSSDAKTSRVARDNALIARVRSGDGSAIAELMRLYAVWLTETALGVVKSPDLAQDVVQDVFVRIWEIRGRLIIKGSVAAYLYRATHNRAYDLQKHERVQNSIALDLDFDETLDSHGTAQIEATEFREALDKALQQLQPRARDIFIMRAEQDMSYEEIAEALGITVSTAYKQVYNASKRLENLLSRWIEPDDSRLESGINPSE